MEAASAADYDFGSPLKSGRLRSHSLDSGAPLVPPPLFPSLCGSGESFVGSCRGKEGGTGLGGGKISNLQENNQTTEARKMNYSAYYHSRKYE